MLSIMFPSTHFTCILPFTFLFCVRACVRACVHACVRACASSSRVSICTSVNVSNESWQAALNVSLKFFISATGKTVSPHKHHVVELDLNDRKQNVWFKNCDYCGYQPPLTIFFIQLPAWYDNYPSSAQIELKII